jgi:hypothetical protein
MKAILLSIKPEHALNILNGNKTLELRKNIPKGYIGWVYCYVTKGKPYLVYDEYLIGYHTHKVDKNMLESFDLIYNSTIPFRFWFDDYSTLSYCDLDVYSDSEYIWQHNKYSKLCGLVDDEIFLTALNLEYQDVINYGFDKKNKRQKDLYAWYIKRLEIFDDPMKLSDFAKDCDYIDTDENGKEVSWHYIPLGTLTKAPQSWQYVWVKGERE